MIQSVGTGLPSRPVTDSIPIRDGKPVPYIIHPIAHGPDVSKINKSPIIIL